MRTFDVTPHKGAGPVLLGMSADAVRIALGLEPSAKKGDRVSYYFRNRLSVYFDSSGQAEYVELSAGEDQFLALFNGVDVFATPADEMVALVERHAPLDKTRPEPGYSFVFPKLDLSFWRPTTDQRVFATIGVGRRGYYGRTT